MMNRLNGILGMFIGIFGALAILGVFFKIANYPGWEVMMAIGFIGEAGAFIVMGIFAMISGFRGGMDQAQASTGRAQAAAPVPDAEAFRGEMQEVVAAFGDELRQRLEASMLQDFSAAMDAIGEQTRATCDEMRSLGGSLAEARASIEAMRETLGEAAAGRLAEDADRLGSGMRSIADGMEQAGSAVETMRRDVTQMAERFRAFNTGTAGSNGHAPVSNRTGATPMS